MSTLKKALTADMSAAFSSALLTLGIDQQSPSPIDPIVSASQHADFQLNGAMGLAKRFALNPRELAAVVQKCALQSDLVDSAAIAGPGFINIQLSAKGLSARLMAVRSDERLGVARAEQQIIVVDYSAPNVAKEMHVGHLRSTIIGDACVRLMEWMGHSVVRRNHIGDWGTPFGMLIEHLIDMGEVEATEALSLGDLNTFYRTAREKFETAEEFQQRARARVVALQSGDAETLRYWTLLIEQSQRYFVSVYDRIDVRLDGSEFFGESSYNDQLQRTLDRLHEQKLVIISDGAECVYPDGFTGRDDTPLPLIVKKSDGGFGYAATDLAALYNRTVELSAKRNLYVVGAPQRQHFDMLFTVGSMCGWLNDTNSAEHIAFGSVLGADGKMLASRSGKTIKLADLLDEAVNRAAAVIDEKNPDLDSAQRAEVAEAVGIGAIKYADLSSERTRDYVFDFDQMLALEGNTAPYLQYANARIQSILRQANRIDREADILIEHSAERVLALSLLEFPDVIDEVLNSLLFHRLANYLYCLATAYSRFYTHCPVLKAGSDNTVQSRLALCQLTATTLTTGLSLLGIRSPEQM